MWQSRRAKSGVNGLLRAETFARSVWLWLRSVTTFGGSHAARAPPAQLWGAVAARWTEGVGRHLATTLSQPPGGAHLGPQILCRADRVRGARRRGRRGRGRLHPP